MKKNLKSSLSDKIIPILLAFSIILAFVTGILWEKVRSLEGGVGSTTAGNAQAQGTAGAAAQPTQATANVNIKDVSTDGEPFIGNANAPVILAYWMDYQCPFCKQFETSTVPTLLDKYVKTGKLKIVFKDFEFLGPDSETAALAERAVWETNPSAFQAWHSAMFEKQDSENSGWGNKDDIIALTKTIPGLDGNKVSTLMDQNKDKYQKEIDADKAEGSKFGISGTPGFIIGTQLIVGAQPADTFTQAIDAQLSSAK